MRSLKKLSALAAAGFVAATLVVTNTGCSRDDGKTAGQTIDDSAITAKVKAAFAQDAGVKAVDVKVDTHLGAVQLSGWVNTPEEKTRAAEVAKTVAGVKSVENKIELKTDVSKK